MLQSFNMRGLTGFAALALTGLLSLIGQTVAKPIPLVVSPGGAGDVVITAQNTLNSTSKGPRLSNKKASGKAQLPLSIVNNFSGSNSTSMNVYITGLDSNNNIVFVSTNGSFFYPDATPSTTPVPVTGAVNIPLGATGTTTTITLPDYISSARVWVAAGTLQFFTVADPDGFNTLVEPSAVNPADPSAGVNWGFVELTNTEEGGLYANISYVDFVGMILGMALQSSDNSTQTAQGLQPNAVASICNDLATQASSDGQPWNELCITDSSGNPLRVLSPNDYIALSPTAFSDYWTDYINQVWSTYTTSNLTIDTQSEAGNVSCVVSNNELTCDGDSRGYAQPAAVDIFGCNTGPFAILPTDNDVHSAIVPRLCAAFDRSSFLVAGGNAQPGPDESLYYTTAPTNYYSKIVHSYELDGKGYAFAYDDVNPDGNNNAAGVVADANPTLLTITVGGPSSSAKRAKRVKRTGIHV